MSFSAEELTEWTSGSWESELPVSIKGFSKDSRTIEEGEIYLALKGDNFDGHDFIADAFKKGASGAVVDKIWKAGEVETPLLRVDDPGKALCDMACNYRMKISPVIVGVTGSAGKSTVKELVAAMLSEKASTAYTKGNWNNQIGLPMSMLSMDSGAEYGVFEVGTNHPGEIGALCSVLKPDLGVITNIGPAHIEYFGSLEAIANEKGDLFRCLPEKGTAVLNGDSECLATLKSAVPCRTVSVSMAGEADYVCIDYDVESGAAFILESESGEKFRFKTPQPGQHNVMNVMQSVAVARGQGLDWDDIASALDKYEPLPMRWAMESIKGVTIINDAYNANPMSMRASVKAFEEMQCEGGKWLVLGDMLELGEAAESEHIALGEFVGKSEWSGVVFIGSLSGELARGTNAAGLSAGRIFVCEDKTGVTEVLSEKLEPGDAVLLKGSRGIGLEEIVEQYSKN
ncbi:hypothetical protein BVX94_02725 [bacterium B17]|nr:hypothetical protein BVX94_02725 [bacterium B17]